MKDKLVTGAIVFACALFAWNVRDVVRWGWFKLTSATPSSPPPISQVLAPIEPRFSRPLLSMYRTDPQLGINGLRIPIDTTTRIWPEGGVLLYGLSRKIRARNTLEIGMAYGFSTLFLLAAAEKNGGRHTAIDPFEVTDWRGVGLQKVREVGMESQFRHIPKLSIHALPDLEREHQRFDLIFIDGSHLFENVLLDFVLCDRICAPNGYIVMDDLLGLSVQKVVNFVARNRADYAHRDSSVQNFAVFQKVGNDQREWNHFADF